MSKWNSQESVETPPIEDRLDLSGGCMPVNDCLLKALALADIGDFASCITPVPLKGVVASVGFCWFL